MTKSKIIKIGLWCAGLAVFWGAAQVGLLLWQLHQIPLPTPNPSAPPPEARAATPEEKSVVAMARYLERASRKERQAFLGTAAPIATAAAPVAGSDFRASGLSVPMPVMTGGMHRELSAYLAGLGSPDRAPDADARMLAELERAPGEAVSAIGSLMAARGADAAENRQKLTVLSKAFADAMPEQVPYLRDELGERIHAAGSFNGSDEERQAMLDDLTAAYAQFASQEQVEGMKNLLKTQETARRDLAGQQSGMPVLGGNVAPGPLVESR